jgi:site-specific DNA-methyltransferase (adenine-specific)
MYFKGENFAIYHGDNRQILPTLAENSVDAIVTDPPYELGFMGKSWDASGVAFDPATWREALRVIKPGGHLIAFSGSRTYHRIAVAIEDAGFEIRDQIMWIYGSGFPKSHNISKGIDKVAGVEREITREEKKPLEQGYPISFDTRSSTERERRDIPATDAARQWEGWGTALKPAHEPMVLARKPLVGTVAANVLTYGTGGLNIDGARVEGEFIETTNGSANAIYGDLSANSGENCKSHNQGRWPANVIHDGSDEVVALFPKTGISVGTRANNKSLTSYGFSDGTFETVGFGDSGSAARFFYCAKASKRDRNEGLDGFEEKRDHDGRQEGGVGGSNPRNRTNNYRQNHHPTVKPTDLMRYLCRLITPPNGTVLDPFMGSGSTGKAAMYEGFKFIGIEMTDEYLPIAKARIEFAVSDNEGFLL